MLPAHAFANTFTFSPTATAANTNSATSQTNQTAYNGGASQFDLDHHKAYTWKLTGLSIPTGQSIISASITFKDIANWDTNTNKLFVHLLNTANNSGIASVTDSSDDTTISDYFGGAKFDDLLVEIVRSTFPAHEHDEMVERHRGLVGAWVKDQGT